MNNIAKVRKKAGLSQAAFGQIFGAAQNTVCNWENGKREPDFEVLKQISGRFSVSIDYLLGKSEAHSMESILGRPSPGAIRIPVYSRVAAGVPIEAIDEILDWEEIPQSWGSGGQKYFATTVRGDSMYPKYIEGDVIIVRIQEDCESGQDCIVYVNGYDATLKRVLKLEDGGIRLVPTNPSYAPKTYYPGEEPISIAGIVVEIRRKP